MPSNMVWPYDNIRDWKRTYEPLADVEDDTVYITINRFNMVDQLSWGQQELIKHLNRNGDITLVAVNVPNSKKVAKMEQWIKAEDFCDQYLVDFDSSVLDKLSEMQAWTAISSATSLHKWDSNYLQHFKDNSDDIAYDFNWVVRLNGIAQRKIEKIQETLDIIPVDAVLDLFNMKESDYKAPAWTKGPIVQAKAIKESVQFLETLSTGYYDANIDKKKGQHAIDYINAMLA